jgi:glutathione peroxidase
MSQRTTPHFLANLARSLMLACLTTAAASTAAACSALLNHTALRLQDEKPQNLCQYAGKVVLVVNTASQCGFTGQYIGLEALQQRLQGQGFTVLGFPSNDFRQEAGDNREIAQFCENQFGVRFPMFAKTRVTGQQASPFYKALTQQAGQAPTWNFHKYLIGRDGRVVAAFAAALEPESFEVQRAIEKQLALPTLKSAITSAATTP